MTVSLKSNGDLVVRKKADEKIQIKAGDHYVVRKSDKTGVVFRRAKPERTGVSQRRTYLTPRPLSRATLERVYSQPDPEWDQVEREAVSKSRKSLAGKRLEEL